MNGTILSELIADYLVEHTRLWGVVSSDQIIRDLNDGNYSDRGMKILLESVKELSQTN